MIGAITTKKQKYYIHCTGDYKTSVGPGFVDKVTQRISKNIAVVDLNKFLNCRTS